MTVISARIIFNKKYIILNPKPMKSSVAKGKESAVPDSLLICVLSLASVASLGFPDSLN